MQLFAHFLLLGRAKEFFGRLKENEISMVSDACMYFIFMKNVKAAVIYARSLLGDQHVVRLK